ncbi:MAG: hypothetical protein KF799_08165 [Bdellovibrionales bacterium]|nr:hypothetical protein [Bdellovibrionales bacterium]
MKRLMLPILLSLGLVAPLAQAKFGRMNTPLLNEDIPADLTFSGVRVTVLQSTWFANMFAMLGENCAFELSSGKSFSAFLEVDSSGPHAINFYFNGDRSRFFRGATATYVPVHYEKGEAIHPYFLIELPGGWKYRLQIHRSGTHKTLTLSMIKGHPGQQTLLPIFTAEGY